MRSARGRVSSESRCVFIDVYTQRGHEHTRRKNWSEEGLERASEGQEALCRVNPCSFTPHFQTPVTTHLFIHTICFHSRTLRLRVKHATFERCWVWGGGGRPCVFLCVVLFLSGCCVCDLFFLLQMDDATPGASHRMFIHTSFTFTVGRCDARRLTPEVNSHLNCIHSRTLRRLVPHTSSQFTPDLHSQSDDATSVTTHLFIHTICFHSRTLRLRANHATFERCWVWGGGGRPWVFLFVVLCLSGCCVRNLFLLIHLICIHSRTMQRPSHLMFIHTSFAFTDGRCNHSASLNALGITNGIAAFKPHLLHNHDIFLAFRLIPPAPPLTPDL